MVAGTSIRALETVAHGYKFRSRLEARWATFLKALYVTFEYEPEGFEIDGHGPYLPDFWLPKLHTWLEIKPVSLFEMDDSERDALMAKLEAFAEQTGQPIVLATGTFDRPIGYAVEDPIDQASFLCMYQFAPKSGIQSVVWAFDLRLRRYSLLSVAGVTSAWEAARQARFEFGEHG